MIKEVAGALALLSVTAAQSAPTQCVPQAEAEALASVLLPDALAAVGERCAAYLPPTATLRAGLSPLLARWRADSAGALPGAAAAVARITGTSAQEADPQAVLAAMRASLVGDAVKSMKPDGCRTVERMTTLLSPLPLSSIAALAITILDAATGNKRDSPIPLCPARP